MAQPSNQISLRSAAVIAGFTTLIMVFCAPFAELYAYPKLVITGNGVATAHNIIAHQTLFALLIMSYLLTFLGDVIVAWALYILMKPVNAYLSLLAALLRLVFAIIALTSLLNLITVFRIVTLPNFLSLFKAGEVQTQIILLTSAFRYGFHFGLIFFGIYLVLLSYLVWKSSYIPSIFGLLLLISGVGYFATSIQPYLFAGANLSLAVYTFYGELLFTLWLIIKGLKIPESH